MSVSAVKRNLIYYFVLSASQVLLPLVSIPYLSRVLDPEGVGRVSFVDSLVYYFVAIAEVGLTVYGTREVARHRDNPGELNKLIPELLLLHLFTSVFSIAVYCLTLFFVFDKIQDIGLVILSLTFLVANSLSCEWYFLGTERFRYISMRSIAIRLLAVISIFVFVKVPADYILYYAIIVVSSIIIVMSNIIILRREHPFKFRSVQWMKHLRLTWITYLISLLTSVFLYLDNVILGVLASAYAVGIYAFAMKIVRVSGALITDPMQVFFPRIVNLVRNGKTEDLQSTLTRCIQLLTTFSVPLAIGTFLLADEIVRIILGPSFIESAGNLRILALFPLLRSHNIFFSKQVLIAHGYEMTALKTLAIGSACLLLLIFALVPWYDSAGVCLAVIVAEATMLLLNYYYAKRAAMQLSIFDWRCFFSSMVSSLIFIPVIYVLRSQLQETWQVLISSFLGCLIIYTVMQLYIFKNSIMVSLRRSGLNFIVKLAE